MSVILGVTLAKQRMGGLFINYFFVIEVKLLITWSWRGGRAVCTKEDDPAHATFYVHCGCYTVAATIQTDFPRRHQAHRISCGESVSYPPPAAA